MDELRTRMQEAAGRLLAALEPEQRERAKYPFEVGGERETWFYTPTDHGGLRLHDMTAEQQDLTHQLVVTGLSHGGYVTAATIMGLENILGMIEGYTSTFPYMPRPRDPMGYSVSIFGDPAESRWGWRFGGHHISLNILVHPEGIRVLPTFFGANPARSEAVGGHLLRPLAPEEDLARDLLHLLSPEQQGRAVLATHAPRDLITGNRPAVAQGNRPRPGWEIVRETGPGFQEEREARDRRFEDALGFTSADHVALEYTDTPKGLLASEMTGHQRQVLRALLDQYVLRMPDEVAAVESARVGAIDPGDLAFLWAGGVTRGEPHYYRVQGPGLLVEYDNTQNDANHIHTVWRDPTRDFGRDLLAEHYAQAH